MSRRLRLAVPVLLSLLAASLAAAASVCEPGSSADAAPDAPFQADAPGALRAEERSRLLSLDDGRYEERDGFLADRRAASAERSLLTNAQTVRLLCPPRGDVKKETSIGRLSVPKALPSPQAVGTLEFDGAARREAGVANPGSAGPTEGPSAGSAEDPPLLREVLARVKIAEDGDPRAAAALRGALRDALRTPTGREVAEDFVALNASAEIRLEKLSGSLLTINGRKILSGVRGEHRNNEGKSVVVVNRMFLDADPEISSREMAGTLAHELFGHALEEQRAARANFPRAALNRYRGDEANARLVGWLVRTELGAPLSDGGMWTYTTNPEAFHRGLARIDPYYAQTLSASEMSDPLPTLNARLKTARGRRADLTADAIEMRKWSFVIEHFVTKHGIERRRFESANQDASDFLELERPRLNQDSDEIVAALQERIDFYGTPKGREQLRQFSDASGSDFIRASEARLARYRARLKFKMEGRKRESLVPPLPDQIDFEALEKLYQDDVRDNPRHWGL